MSTLERVPPHLRHLIVEQDYSRYTAIDQAVWRFVLLQTHARLKASAHPAYAAGLGQTGISVERIPTIAEMDQRLSELGWGAVCVDGFIPPRAFQELQSLSILPIAADMRSADHLVYTPAPDIIHEAAGHAPILPDATYAEYLRRVGAAGARAFTLPDDAAVYPAIYALSELKEDPTATPEQVAQAEGRVLEARRSVRRVSEAARLSRLYWWTAEYGLVGTPRDYKLYGAGLLSSLWESFACHDPQVRKVVLTPDASDVDYDITKPQPQLFVVESFDALHDVLEQVMRRLPSVQGGEAALAEALSAGEIASIALQGGLQLYGCLTQRVGGERSRLLRVSRGARADLGSARVRAEEICALLGDVSALSSLEPGEVDATLPDGVRLRGVLERVERGGGGAALLVMRSGVLTLGTELTHAFERGAPLALAPAALGAQAGAPSDFFPPTELPRTKVPKARSLPPREGAMLGLYESALSALGSQVASEVVPAFERLHRELERQFKHDWLLRWNLLESLQKLHVENDLSRALRAELVELESYFEGRQPIASGLRYLAATFGKPAA